MKNKKVVLLGGHDISTYIMYNWLKNKYNIEHVVLDARVDRKTFIKKRIKRLGIIKVLGQIAFSLFICPFLRIEAKSRIKEIYREKNLDVTPIPSNIMTCGYSVNSKEVQNLLKKINPDLIIVNGTRIISKKTLTCVGCRFINTHSGITPKYRGVHGGYWALVNKDYENCGVTVHFVDEGIDTGCVIAKSRISVTNKDNFFTYPILQIAEGVRLMDKVLKDLFLGSLVQENGTQESAIWSHPTFWEYIKFRVLKGVK